MIGTILNVAGIVIGGMAGLLRKKPLPVAVESWAKVVLGVFAVFYGLKLTVQSFSGSVGHILKQLLILVVALTLGRLIGRGLRLQKSSNRLGQKAKDSLAGAASAPPSFSSGFKTCATLFCAAPLGMVGAIEDGLSGYFYPLIIKGFIDGLGTMGFVRIFGWSAIVSALPVLAFQGTLTLLARYLAPWLQHMNVVWSIDAAGGMLIFCVALVILQIKRVELADYLPSLLVAPCLAAIFR